MQLPLSTPAVLVLAAACLTACNSNPDEVELRAAVGSRAVAPPLVLDGSAYEAAGAVALPEVPPGEYPGIHNVYRLSDTIISGSEPHDDEALALIASWGVKTILSVDGKVPDVETAESFGMRYVHVPIQYKGITDEELAKIAKTFRETEGPFFVHCFHGKHRGPAAAAVGRVAVDGVPRDQAIAEMRQWCATSGKYEGLYSTVATADIPTAAETAAYPFDFDSAHAFEGKRQAMVAMTRNWDNIKLLRKNGWQPDPAHPDIDPLQEATQVQQLYAACLEMDETDEYPAEYREWMQAGYEGTQQLVQFLSDCRTEGSSPEELAESLEEAFTAVNESCLDCHSVYRN